MFLPVSVTAKPYDMQGSVTIQYTVSNQGRFTNIEVMNSPDPRFTQCIRSRSGGIAPMGGGPSASAQITVNLTAS